MGLSFTMDGHIYIHIPFCLSKCRYCAFSSIVTREVPEDRYLMALFREAALYRDRGVFSSGSIQTLYIGGGTPTLFTPSGIKRLIEGLRNIWTFSEQAEISIESNPETLDLRYAKGLKGAGITRISMGAQSFSARLLKYLGRIHTPEKSVQGFLHLRDAGFDNINIDLILGVPGEKPEELETDLDWIEKLRPEHVSAYLLQHEPGTWFAGVKPCDEDKVATFFARVVDRLSIIGFQHYEISNYARPGFRCRHNMAYWAYKPYLGLGAASVSCIVEGKRWENVKDPYKYMTRIERGLDPVETVDSLDTKEIAFEKKFLSLRTDHGIDVKDMPEHLPLGLFEIKGNRAVLTKKGMLVSDEIFSLL